MLIGSLLDKEVRRVQRERRRGRGSEYGLGWVTASYHSLKQSKLGVASTSTVAQCMLSEH